MKSLSHVRLFATPWTIAYQAPPSMGFSRQEYWSGLPLPSPGDLPDPGIEPGSPTFQADALTSEPPGKPIFMQKFHYNTMKTGTSRRGLLRSILASLVAQQSRICPPMHETSWVGKIPWRKKWLPTPVFLSGEYHVQRSLAGYSPWGRRVRRDLVIKQQGLSFQMGQNRGVGSLPF